MKSAFEVMAVQLQWKVTVLKEVGRGSYKEANRTCWRDSHGKCLVSLDCITWGGGVGCGLAGGSRAGLEARLHFIPEV